MSEKVSLSNTSWKSGNWVVVPEGTQTQKDILSRGKESM